MKISLCPHLKLCQKGATRITRWFINRTIILLLMMCIPIYFIIELTLSQHDSTLCYGDKAETLPDILDVSPSKGKSIFFVETSCKSSLHGKLLITAREACAVESAARLHPNYEIYLLYVAPGIFKLEDWESDRFIKALLSYGNVKIRHIDLESYVANTLVEELYTKGKMQQSAYAASHTSDVLRYLTLWKYGGIYLDLDVVVMRSLEGLNSNYAGAESYELVASGILNFSPTGVGHQLVTQCLRDLQYNFDGRHWGRNNGPGIITKLAKRICAAEDAADMVGMECIGDFRVYSSETFYPIHWKKWEMYFDPDAREAVEALTKNSYMLHLWSQYSRSRKLRVDSKAPYVLFAQKYCPKVFNECKEFF